MKAYFKKTGIGYIIKIGIKNFHNHKNDWPKRYTVVFFCFKVVCILSLSIFLYYE